MVFPRHEWMQQQQSEKHSALNAKTDTFVNWDKGYWTVIGTSSQAEGTDNVKHEYRFELIWDAPYTRLFDLEFQPFHCPRVGHTIGGGQISSLTIYE
jgi:hypothetical protein